MGKSKNDRVNAFAAANLALASINTYGVVSDFKKIINPSSSPSNKSPNTGNQNGENKGEDTSLIGVQITYGQQKSVSTPHTEGNTAVKSQVNAGGKVNIVAAGANGNSKSDINIIGSDISGKGGTTLIVDNQVNIKAAEQNHMERSNNKSSGFGAGVALKFGKGGGFGITASGNYGKGYGNGDETSYVASHVGDMNSQTTIKAGGDANVIGSQVKGKRVELNAENLHIESLQDKATYKGKQMNVSGSVTVGYGFSASGSFNKSKINADYASVNEQAGIYAGDNGYDIKVNKHTDLKGAIVTSTQQAEDEGKNNLSTATFSHSDIENHSNYRGMSIGLDGGFAIGGGKTMAKDIGGAQLMVIGTNHQPKGQGILDQSDTVGTGKLTTNKAIGFGYDSEHAKDITRSGINTANIEIRDEQAQFAKTGKSIQATLASIKTDVTTDNAEQHAGKLENNFDKDKVQKELRSTTRGNTII